MSAPLHQPDAREALDGVRRHDGAAQYRPRHRLLPGPAGGVGGALPRGDLLVKNRRAVRLRGAAGAVLPGARDGGPARQHRRGARQVLQRAPRRVHTGPGRMGEFSQII